MNADDQLNARKADHIRINLEQDVRSAATNGLDQYMFIHEALPEIDLDEIRLDQQLFGKSLALPLLISSMTGGTDRAGQINRVLAEAAQERGVAMGLGSMRPALVRPDTAATFQVRQYAPDIILMANLGAVQLNYGVSVDDCRRVVDLVEADALILHLNPMQEALQPEGDTRFSGLIEKIAGICSRLGKPVVVKEVGWGISAGTAARLKDAGVAAIDVAGAGGTSWSQVEMYRNELPWRARVAAAFRGWGIPTAEAIRQVHAAVPGIPVFASGGLQNGLDIAKCLALGAHLGGMAGPFLKAANQSVDAVLELIDEIALTLRVALFATGSADLEQLRAGKLVRGGGDC